MYCMSQRTMAHLERREPRRRCSLEPPASRAVHGSRSHRPSAAAAVRAEPGCEVRCKASAHVLELHPAGSPSRSRRVVFCPEPTGGRETHLALGLGVTGGAPGAIASLLVLLPARALELTPRFVLLAGGDMRYNGMQMLRRVLAKCTGAVKSEMPGRMRDKRESAGEREREPVFERGRDSAAA